VPTGVLSTATPSKLDVAKDTLLPKIDREATRLARRVKAVTSDLQRGRDAETRAEQAQPFVAEAARAPRGTEKLVALDWSSGEPVPRELPLDPAKRPREQVEAIFAEARRMKRGSAVAHARLDEAHAKRARLAIFRESVVAATSVDELTGACDALRREDPSLVPGLAALTEKRTGTPVRKAASPRLPYRTFLSEAGARILVGRGASDNDELTLHVARPPDLWLHARAERGAHVVVPLKRGHDAPSDLLVDAAHLAAHFSDARGEALVDVTYAPRRFVRKRRGAPPGQVQVDREKTLVLRVDPARLAALLAREEDA
jgi:predicted ribosome quality control (RQC) complex YloA/Tae2 family protein